MVIRTFLAKKRRCNEAENGVRHGEGELQAGQVRYVCGQPKQMGICTCTLALGLRRSGSPDGF